MIGGNHKSLIIKGSVSAYGLFFFLLLLPFEYPLAMLGVGSILRYVGIAVMGLAVLDIFRLGGKLRVDYRLILLLLWMLYAVISGLWCMDSVLYNYYVSMYINNSLMLLFVSAVRYTKEDAHLILKGFIGGIVVLLLYMIFIPGAVVSSSWQSRLTLAYKGEELLDQNYLAALMLMPYGITLYNLLNTKNKKHIQVLRGVFCLVVVYYILRTGSRGGLLAAGVVTFFSLCAGIKKRSKTTLVLLAVALIAAPMVLSILPEELLERFSLEAMTGKTSESEGRLQIWAASWEAIKSGNILFGYGAGSAEAVIGQWHSEKVATHNAVIAHALELGVVGLSLFVSLIVCMLRELWQNRNRSTFFAFFGIIAASMFLDVLTTKFFWGAMMILSVTISAHRTQNALDADNALKHTLCTGESDDQSALDQ